MMAQNYVEIRVSDSKKASHMKCCYHLETNRNKRTKKNSKQRDTAKKNKFNNNGNVAGDDDNA